MTTAERAYVSGFRLRKKCPAGHDLAVTGYEVMGHARCRVCDDARRKKQAAIAAKEGNS